MFHVSASTVYKNLLFDVLIDNNGPSSNKKLIQGSIKATECCPCKFTGYENCDIANTMYYYSILGPDKPVAKIGSDSSPAYRSATGVSVTGPRR